MRHLVIDVSSMPPDVQERLDTWVSRGRAKDEENCAAVAAGRAVSLSDGIWKSIKEILQTYVYRGVCGFCEGDYVGHAYGAADHYRPKGRVSEMSDGGLVIIETAGGQHHPGYYWLAHNMDNIVPTCDRCNTGWKRDRFAVDGKRADAHSQLTDPGAVATLNIQERPLLLHPVFDDPSDHLQFGLSGVVAARDGSVRGRETISCLGLADEALTSRRAEQQDALRSALILEMVTFVQNPSQGGGRLDEGLDRVRERFLRQGRPYASSVAFAFERYLLDCIRALGIVETPAGSA